jgi:hypothetical protein
MFYLAIDFTEEYEGWDIEEIESIKKLKEKVNFLEEELQNNKKYSHPYMIFKEVTLAEVVEALEKEGKT